MIYNCACLQIVVYTKLDKWKLEEADSYDELKNAFMRNHTYATFAYLKDKYFLVFKFFEIAYTRFCHLFSSPFTICSYEVL